MHITLCILTRNERPCLDAVIPRIPPPGPAVGFDDVVAIDGASTDGTVEYFQERGIRVVGQSRRGRGEAFLIAFAEIETDAYIFFSPDGNEDPADLPRFRPLLEAGNDIVIASRMCAGARNEEDGQFLRPRKWANNVFNLAANLAFRHSGPYVTDSINGYRAITRTAARTLDLDAPRYTIEYQMTMRAMRAGMRIVEFPTIEAPRVAGEAQARSIPTGLAFVGALWSELRAGRPRTN